MVDLVAEDSVKEVEEGEDSGEEEGAAKGSVALAREEGMVDSVPEARVCHRRTHAGLAGT